MNLAQHVCSSDSWSNLTQARGRDSSSQSLAIDSRWIGSYVQLTIAFMWSLHSLFQALRISGLFRAVRISPSILATFIASSSDALLISSLRRIISPL